MRPSAASQVGTDISKLNINGWNIHLGTTAGYPRSHANDNSGGSANFEVPFIGTYLVATHGRFFADLMVRESSTVRTSPIRRSACSAAGRRPRVFDLDVGRL